MSSECGFYIPDGYTITAKINGVRGFYPDIIITYRPLTRGQVNAVATKLSMDESPDEQEKICCKVVVDHLKAWDLKFRDSKLPITVDVVSHLGSALFDRLYNILMGRSAPDEYLDNEQPHAKDGSLDEAAAAKN